MRSREAKLAQYTSLWTELNAVNSLIEELEKTRAEIKAKQRQLANALVKDETEGNSE